jgi:hypothetical protein
VTAGAVVVLLLLLAPRAAHACASCLWSAYGDRTFNWAFLGLIIMPFVVAAVIGGALLHVHRRRGRPRVQAADGPDVNPLLKETT